MYPNKHFLKKKERLINENEEQRNLRLQRLRESQSIRIQADTEQQRHDRLQIARDNNARRTEVETNEERQNRLQLLQQNVAMYRENERLQHLQDVEKCRTAFTRTTMNTASRLLLETKPLPFCVQDSV